MEAARHLHILNPETGEITEQTCPYCAVKDDEIEGLQRDIRGWAARHAALKRDKEAEARAHKYWPVAVELFQHWQEVCNHPGCDWDADRFFLVEPFIRKNGRDLCQRAIDGAAYDPFITTRKNGTKKRHDGWELIFRERGKFEEFANKAPAGWTPVTA